MGKQEKDFVGKQQIGIQHLEIMNARQMQMQIERIKTQLLKLGPMRPGTLSCQFKDRENKKGPFWQLSYTYQMKSKTEYVRPAFLKQIKTETANFKKFKKLTQQWVDLSLALSKEMVRTASEDSLT